MLGIFALVAALLAVGRLATANDRTTATDATVSISSTASSADDDGATDAASDDTSDQPGKGDKKKKQAADKKAKKNKKGDKRSRNLRKKVQLAADGLPAPPATFRIGSFNLLGHSHTTKGGNKRGYASGTTRIGWAVQLIRGNNISVVGLQEYEPIQHNRFVGLTGGGWGVYPGMQIKKGVRNSIAWNKSVWELVQAHTIPIPYFHGNLVPMPYIQLKHKETGRLAWFINIHNPASTRGPAQHWRNVATSKEIALMNQLQAPESPHKPGIPTFLTGDFNEKAEAFCRVTAGANAQAANGGTRSPCRLPPKHGIDWIFGSTPGVEFSNYVRLDGGLVDRTSDHPLIHAQVTLTGEAPYIEP